VGQALTQGGLSLEQRKQLAIKAFAHTRDYDTAIHAYLANSSPITYLQLGIDFSLALVRTQDLRYGENPHQEAGFYSSALDAGPLGGELRQGKPLSYNNLLDADAAWRAASSFDPIEHAAVVIVKHLTPTGIAIGSSLAEAFPNALASDPVSAFGGVIAVNRPVDEAFVQALGTLFIEVIIAPDFSAEAQALLASGRKNCRLIAVPQLANRPELEIRSVVGGLLIQTRDLGDPPDTNWEVVTQRHPTPNELQALKFAWRAVQHVKSNAIVLANANTTLGVGGGLPSRVDAVYLAVAKAGARAKGAVMASDAFFPFPDGVDVAIQAGVTAVIQPGGSIRDQEVIETANAAEVAMVFSKVRHFRH
jgi:phosphoribosylaminoimidazolecarboxamide formyltransferase/IMP cyclohydrolase